MAGVMTTEGGPRCAVPVAFGPDIALFLDFDGTLVDIADRPDAITVPETLVPLLAQLSRSLHGALALITGRGIAELDRYLHPFRPVTAGVHGAEMRLLEDGAIQRRAPALDLEIVAAVERIAGHFPDTLIEHKKSSIAIHFRSDPAAALNLEADLRDLLSLYPDRLMLCPGRKVYEVVSRGVSKGAALEMLAQLPAFQGRRPIMIGDDYSDESAIDAAARLGGCGLRVGGEHFNGATAHFSDPTGVRAWLAQLEGSHRDAPAPLA